MAITDRLDLKIPVRKLTIDRKKRLASIELNESDKAEEVKNQLDSSGQAPA